MSGRLSEDVEARGSKSSSSSGDLNSLLSFSLAWNKLLLLVPLEGGKENDFL